MGFWLILVSHFLKSNTIWILIWVLIRMVFFILIKDIRAYGSKLSEIFIIYNASGKLSLRLAFWKCHPNAKRLLLTNSILYFRPIQSLLFYRKCLENFNHRNFSCIKDQPSSSLVIEKNTDSLLFSLMIIIVLINTLKLEFFQFSSESYCSHSIKQDSISVDEPFLNILRNF